MDKLTLSNFAEHTSNGLVIVDFFAERCGPCKFIAPHLETLANHLEGKASFYKVDVDQEQQLAGQQDITAMPTMKVFKDGQLVETIVGADLEKLVSVIQSNLG